MEATRLVHSTVIETGVYELLEKKTVDEAFYI